MNNSLILIKVLTLKRKAGTSNPNPSTFYQMKSRENFNFINYFKQKCMFNPNRRLSICTAGVSSGELSWVYAHSSVITRTSSLNADM
jgi:hypothetical protein